MKTRPTRHGYKFEVAVEQTPEKPNQDYALRPISAPRWEMMRGKKSAFGLAGWLTTLLYKRWPKTGPRTGQSPYYMIEAFIELQHIINLSFMELHSTQGRYHKPEVETYRKYPL